MVVDGMFSVELSVSQSSFYGRAIWIQPEVDTVPLGCQEILPVPYALSLRPGAIIGGDKEFGDVIRVVNTASSNDSYGVYGESYSNYYGIGVYGYASATSGPVYGVYGSTRSPDGAGVVAQRNQAPPLLDEGRRPNVIRVENGSVSRELRRLIACSVLSQLFVPIDEYANVFFEGR